MQSKAIDLEYNSKMLSQDPPQHMPEEQTIKSLDELFQEAVCKELLIDP